MFSTKQFQSSMLSPACYFDSTIYELEVQRIFERCWLPVGLLDDIPESGDFLTTELLGRSILVRNHAGQMQAFSNVCAHRRCLIRSEARGSAGPLTCQYHGWTYDHDGRVSSLPYPESFASLDFGRLRLRPFPTERCGRMIFVRIRKDGVSLRDYLGDAFGRIAGRCSDEFEQFAAVHREYDVNWKLAHENQLEDTHVRFIHPSSFGGAVSEAWAQTTLEEGGTEYHVRQPEELIPFAPATRRLLFGLWERVWGSKPYGHHVLDRFPTLHVVWENDGWPATTVSWLTPTGPTSCRHDVRALFKKKRHFNFAQNLFWPLVRAGHLGMMNQVLSEDAGIYEAAQRGMENGGSSSGLLGMREERVGSFQDFVRRRVFEEPDVLDQGTDEAMADPLSGCGTDQMKQSEEGPT